MSVGGKWCSSKRPVDETSGPGKERIKMLCIVLNYGLKSTSSNYKMFVSMNRDNNTHVHYIIEQ